MISLYPWNPVVSLPCGASLAGSPEPDAPPALPGTSVCSAPDSPGGYQTLPDSAKLL